MTKGEEGRKRLAVSALPELYSSPDAMPSLSPAPLNSQSTIRGIIVGEGHTLHTHTSLSLEEGQAHSCIVVCLRLDISQELPTLLPILIRTPASAW